MQVPTDFVLRVDRLNHPRMGVVEHSAEPRGGKLRVDQAFLQPLQGGLTIEQSARRGQKLVGIVLGAFEQFEQLTIRCDVAARAADFVFQLDAGAPQVAVARLLLTQAP